MAKKKASRKPRRTETEVSHETVESSQSVQLLLGNMMEQKDRAYYMETWLKLKAKADTATSHLRDFRKKAKEAGVNVQAMTDTLKMERLDPLEVADYLKQQMMFFRDRGMPVQLSLYEPKYDSVEQQAQHMGWDAGINGRSPPIDLFPENTPGYEPMLKAWNDAQAQLIENARMDSETPLLQE